MRLHFFKIKAFYASDFLLPMLNWKGREFNNILGKGFLHDWYS